jgi:hypothetical protein
MNPLPNVSFTSVTLIFAACAAASASSPEAETRTTPRRFLDDEVILDVDDDFESLFFLLLRNKAED